MPINWNSLKSPETESEGRQEIQEDTEYFVGFYCD